MYLVSPQNKYPPIILEASGVTEGMNASLIGPGPHTDRKKKRGRKLNMCHL